MAENQQHPNIKQRFGKAIRRRRRELDLSQEELAERAEMHRTYISDIERGIVNPSLEVIEKLTDALNTTVSELFVQYGIDHQEVRDHDSAE
ncbi:helix-turn-helix domain-containing protein [Leptolyngbya sp. NIES-2104]|uniref:helix-turn-helix domain-containing protein n=1 Tax=Leptolyngbya sp. NIES-2104 TaxID=1552121 RepID=UPI00073E3D52|nr:helix-turn-helix transcriptional regulator [Leptolyngbya sp. NIES-2104]